jgi:hypothetical protein
LRPWSHIHGLQPFARRTAGALNRSRACSTDRSLRRRHPAA